MKKINFNTSHSRSIIGLMILIISLVIVLAVISPEYMSYIFLYEFLKRIGEYVVMAIGLTIIFISGEFDLSFGSVMALSGLICGKIYMMGLPFEVALIAGIAVGLVFGYIHSVLVIKLKLDSFIVTLATLQIGRSLVYVIAQGKTFVGFPRGFESISDIRILGIPLLFIITILILLLGIFLLNKTTIGRNIYATGGNERAAIISGIKVNKIKYFVFMLSGFLASVAGLMFAARLKSVPPTAGLSVVLEVLTAVVLGGTLVTGGVGALSGSFLGIIALLLFVNIFSINAIDPYWNIIILGAAVILILGFNSIRDSIKKLFHNKKILDNPKIK